MWFNVYICFLLVFCMLFRYFQIFIYYNFISFNVYAYVFHVICSKIITFYMHDDVHFFLKFLLFYHVTQQVCLDFICVLYFLMLCMMLIWFIFGFPYHLFKIFDLNYKSLCLKFICDIQFFLKFCYVIQHVFLPFLYAFQIFSVLFGLKFIIYYGVS